MPAELLAFCSEGETVQRLTRMVKRHDIVSRSTGKRLTGAQVKRVNGERVNAVQRLNGERFCKRFFDLYCMCDVLLYLGGQV